MDAASIDKFLRERCYIELLKAAREEGPLVVDFNDLDRFNPISADQLLEIPEKIIDEFNKAATKIAEHKICVRIKNIPERRNIRIRNLRAKHLGKLLCIDAIIKSASDVRPQIYEAVFECPECSAKLVVPQETNLMQKPYVCGDPFVKGGCGRRGDFSQIEKKMMDTRWLFGVEPFELTTGEHPGEISIFLKDDLTTPKMQKKTDPGNKITIVGILKELPKRIKGKLSTKMDMYVEANYLAPSEIDFEELEISQEDEINIREMAADPAIYEKLKASIAPGIYGFDEIKEAIVLQLFGGIPHVLPDGNRIRGNIHILLTGDPGVGKSVTGSMKILHNSDDSVEYESIGNMIDRILITQKGINHGDAEICANTRGVKVLTLNPKTQCVEWKPVSLFIRHKSPETLVKIKTKSGREIIATRDHSFVVMDEDGNITTVEGNKSKGSFVPVPLNSHRELISEIALPQEIRTNAKALPEKIKLDWNFGFFLGLFIAEGSVNDKGNIFIYSKNPERKDKIGSFLKSVGMSAKIDEERILTSSKNMVKFLENNCYKGEKTTTGKGSGASRKCLPSFCFFAPKEFIYGLLSGLFSGDGYFVNSKPCAGRKKGNLKIGFTSISEELAYGLLDILSLVGLFATIRKRNYIYNSKEKKCYEILVRWDYATEFMERIAMIGKKPSIPRISEKDAIDSLPCTGLLYSIVKELGYSKRLIKDAAARRSFAAMMRTVRSRGFIGRRRMKRVYEQLLSESEAKNNALVMKKLERLKSILESNVVWDRIIKTEEMPSNEKYVYDLSVEGNENFTVNNVIVHNTMFLKLVSSVVPRGRYVSGSGVSGAGLTATVVKNEAIGGWVLEAGALILCNKGLIAIDEFDKMSKDDQIAMHEATSVETVSIAKASIVATLPAQTAVLAGANPKLGRFDSYQSIAEQINIPETLLSRFDLKFALRDKPDKAADERLAEHVILSRTTPELVEPLIRTALLRKYIAYAKQINHMELLPETGEMLKNFYVDMRNQYSGEDIQTVSITLRQYEALLRMAEASAKIRLDKKIRIEDAERAVRLMKYSLMQLGMDTETGRIDIDKMESGITATKRRKIGIIMDILESMQKGSKEVSVNDIKAEAESQGVEKVEDILDKLKRDGMIFEPKPGFIKKV